MARLPSFDPDESLKDLYLLRHGETTWNRDNRIQGHRDPALSRLGCAQVRTTARHLRGRGIERIFVSDLRRALQSAQIVERVLRVPVTIVPELREIDLGAWEGLTPDQVNRRFRNGYAKWMASPSSVTIPQAEPMQAFRRRVRRCWRRDLVSGQERSILVVTHGGVITALLSHLLRAKFDTLIIGLAINNASLTHVALRGAQVRVEQINHTWHPTR